MSFVCGFASVCSAVNWRYSPLGNLINISLDLSIGIRKMGGAELERGLILKAPEDFLKFQCQKSSQTN